MPLDCPEAIAKLIDECLEVEPSKRPTAKQCFERMRAADGAHSPLEDICAPELPVRIDFTSSARSV